MALKELTACADDPTKSHRNIGLARQRSEREGKPVAPQRSREKYMAIKPKAKASRSTYLDIGLVHIGRLKKVSSGFIVDV